MAYTSVRGRKPMERASKIAHTEIINNPDVQAYLEGCSIPKLLFRRRLSSGSTL
jgi:hypothetical protein